jgi:hypothetical protein
LLQSTERCGFVLKLRHNFLNFSQGIAMNVLRKIRVGLAECKFGGEKAIGK